MGGPIDPCLLTPEGGFRVAVPTSVIPYASVMGNPAAAANSASSSVEALSAAERHRRSEARRLCTSCWERVWGLAADDVAFGPVLVGGIASRCWWSQSRGWRIGVRAVG